MNKFHKGPTVLNFRYPYGLLSRIAFGPRWWIVPYRNEGAVSPFANTAHKNVGVELTCPYENLKPNVSNNRIFKIGKYWFLFIRKTVGWH